MPELRTEKPGLGNTEYMKLIAKEWQAKKGKNLAIAGKKALSKK